MDESASGTPAPPTKRVDPVRLVVALSVTVGVLAVAPAFWLRGQPPFAWYSLRSAPFPLGIGASLLWSVVLIPPDILISHALAKYATSGTMLVPSEEPPSAKKLYIELNAPLWSVAWKVLLLAALEELVFRVGIFQGIGFLASRALPDPVAFGIGSIVSTFLFVISHEYGELLPRAWGGLLYCLFLRLTGSIPLIVLAHALSNLFVAALLRHVRLAKP